MRVIIVGAGIGGLTLALSLHQAGIETEIYEAVREIRPVGVGINLLPHAVRELTELGLAEALAAQAIPTAALMYANKFGQEIWREPRGRAAGYNWPQYSIHRGAFQMTLLKTVVARLGAEAVQSGCAAVGVDTDSSAVTFERTDGRRFTARGDLVVAADGIHSALRRQFYPAEGAPIWNGRVLWRGVTRGKPFLDGRTMVMAGHQDCKFVCYAIDPSLEPGGALINWIAELTFPKQDGWRKEDWNREGKLADFLPRFEEWNFPWLDVPALIRAGERVYEYPLVDRDPLARWTHGRTTLLGDAAHPMYPIGSNGASQAILDARTLAYELAQPQDIETALARYEESRRPATSRLVMLNRGNGPEQVMQLAEERAPQGFTDVHDVLSRAELEAIATGYKKAAGFDCETLNTRASLTPRAAA
jgi:2-polyprenyl-6-methoxyphenol hydroxylase-like FAD-dependent oxidoreductase